MIGRYILDHRMVDGNRKRENLAAGHRHLGESPAFSAILVKVEAQAVRKKGVGRVAAACELSEAGDPGKRHWREMPNHGRRKQKDGCPYAPPQPFAFPGWGRRGRLLLRCFQVSQHLARRPISPFAVLLKCSGDYHFHRDRGVSI